MVDFGDGMRWDAIEWRINVFLSLFSCGDGKLVVIVALTILLDITD